MRLGSAVGKVNRQVGIMDHLMGAGGPHWCEDPVVDRENQVGTELGGRLALLIHLFLRILQKKTEPNTNGL